MARQIIILERSQPWPGAISVSAAFWIAVPAGQEAPRPGFVSAVRGPDEPTAPELAALQLGSVHELVVSSVIPASYNLASSQAFLEAMYASAVAAFVAPGQVYGRTWDGSTWSAGAD